MIDECDAAHAKPVRGCQPQSQAQILGASCMRTKCALPLYASR